jgi:hypothetical protein
VEGERREFLPPQPAGPEPELGGKPPQGGPQPPPEGGWLPPHGHAPQQGWQQPPTWGPRPVEPDNGPAVAGFVLSLVAGGLLFVSAGLSTIVSVGCAIFGMVYSRRGKRKVASGETTKNAGLAQAGWIVGIVSLVLAVLATLAWLAILIAAISSEEFRDDLEREFDNSDSITAALRITAAAVRSLLG